MSEKTCRLCLNTISDSDFQPVENWKVILNELLLNVNLDISDETVVCHTCANYLQIFSNLKKSASTNIEDIKPVLLDTKIEKLDPEEANSTDINSVGDQKTCRFCRKLLGILDYISLNETKENMFLVDMLQKHIPEWNLNYAEELLSCYNCLDSLQSVLNFVMNCLDVEEKINRYVEMRGTNCNGHVELNDVQRFTFKPMSKWEASSTMKGEDDNCEENMIMKTEAEIKSAEADLNIKPEELDIILKEDNCERFQDPSSGLKTSNGSLDIPVFKSKKSKGKTVHKCEACSYETTRLFLLNRHKLTHESTSSTFKCDMCPYEGKRSDHLKKHKLTHKSKKSKEKTTHKCETCSYETNSLYSLNRHKLTHESTPPRMFKCDMCPYEGKRLDHLKGHKLIHKSASEITMYKCKLCPYEARQQPHLKRHMMTHKTPSDMFKCKLCSYETKHQGHIKRHYSVHKEETLEEKKPLETLSEIKKLFKCQLCPYKAKRRSILNWHELTHKCPSEITMFKCEQCPYESKRKYNLKQHTLLHKNPADRVMFKCKLCPYGARSRGHLVQHELTHKNSSKLKELKCDMCPYEAKHKYGLDQHKLTHKNPADVAKFKCKFCPYKSKYQCNFKRHKLIHLPAIFRCELCSYESKYSSNLSRHKLIHSPAIFRCELCSYETKHQGFLKRHKLTHESPSEIEIEIQIVP